MNPSPGQNQPFPPKYGLGSGKGISSGVRIGVGGEGIWLRGGGLAQAGEEVGSGGRGGLVQLGRKFGSRGLVKVVVVGGGLVQVGGEGLVSGGGLAKSKLR